MPRSTSRVAVVTGGTAGIGRATVRAFAQKGYDVAFLARGADGLAATALEVRATGQRALPLQVDVSDGAAVEAAAERIESELGPIDVWVNNAFAGAIAFFEEVTPEEFERITAVTYLGFVNGTRSALKRMRPRDRGVVIQVGSALAYRGIPLQAAYCGAKHAIRGFTESVRTELMHHGSGVQLCDVHMPAVNTPQFDWVLHRGIDTHPQPVPPIYQPEVAARAVVHVAEHPRRTTMVGLPTLLTALGNRVAPWLLDRFLARTNVEAQQNPDKGRPSETVNLWEPVPGDHGAHGAFDDSAHAHSPQAILGRHRGAAVVAALAVAGTAVTTARRRS